MNVHFIAIGGSAMHNLAIALHKKGFTITGSDDEIFEPSKSRLEKYGLLPTKKGWHPEIINKKIDAIILGMHAFKDNPELLKAQSLGLKIYSYPEFLYEQTSDKIRIVIGGSHGKTTITSMVMHVLKTNGIDFDYMVGANLKGFETMVSLKKETKIAVFEGDEYLSSPIDRRSKFHLYHPDIALISGIAWDHINVFPTFENYVKQFEIFADTIQKNGSLIYYKKDENLIKIAAGIRSDITAIPYGEEKSITENGITYLIEGNKKISLNIFGHHNLQNIEGARMICIKAGLTSEQFYNAIHSFKGAERRLQTLSKNESCRVFYDFAHSPSKLKATLNAVKDQFPDKKLVAVMELHTFSSLKKEFLPQYKGTMEMADEAYVFFNPMAVKQKQLIPITKKEVENGFEKKGLKVYTDAKKLFQKLLEEDWKEKNLLLMSSGTFAGTNLSEIAKKITDF
ncbi:MAG: peptidoglycan synthetase [Prolixibacteraceae bacterium]|nr:peptidoglycan synthetase [Prolixibacteraceae bacterium]